MNEEKAHEILECLSDKDSASLVILIGETSQRDEVIKKFTKVRSHFIFKSKPQVTFEDFRDAYYQAYKVHRDINKWITLYDSMMQWIRIKNFVFVLDEISYLAETDPEFLSTLKWAWDNIFSTNPQLVMILGSSDEVWVREKINFNPAFVGRISQIIRLDNERQQS